MKGIRNIAIATAVTLTMAWSTLGASSATIPAASLTPRVRTTAGAKAVPRSSAMPPNFIHIMVDDMAADAVGFRGRFPFLKTPNIDRLARAGAVFNNFFVSTSLCGPSRASILTGRHAHGTGVTDNSEKNDPDPSLPTYPALLRDAGYVTAHIGKWHQGAGDHPRTGFSYWFGFDGQGRYFDPIMNRNGRRQEHKGYVTDILTDETIAFITANRDHPFAINLWHKAAHGPFQPAPRHVGVFKDVELSKPATWDDDLASKPAWMRRRRVFGAHLDSWRSSEGKEIPASVLPGEFNQENTANILNHLCTLLAVDDSLGRIVEALEENGLLETTVVIFTADNGFFLGEFGSSDKRLAYEPSIRVPMILHYPPINHGGRRIDAIGTNLDFAPTFLDWAGVQIPSSMQGESLRPLLEGRTERVRDHLFYEYFQEEFAPGIPTILAIRTSRWKYIQYPYETAAEDELYDLQADPHEQHSLARDSAHAGTLAMLRATLAADLQRFGYRRPEYRYEPSGHN